MMTTAAYPLRGWRDHEMEVRVTERIVRVKKLIVE